MVILTKVRGSMSYVPYVEVNVDTVYIRSNIKKIDTNIFKGFEYDEIQYSVKEYIENLTTSEDSKSMALIIAMLMSEIDYIKQRLEKLEVR